MSPKLLFVYFTCAVLVILYTVTDESDLPDHPPLYSINYTINTDIMTGHAHVHISWTRPNSERGREGEGEGEGGREREREGGRERERDIGEENYCMVINVIVDIIIIIIYFYYL